VSARLNPRRRSRKAGNAATITGNLSAPKARDGRVDAKAPGIAASVMFANATASPPNGGAFTARFVRPWLAPKRYSRWGVT
jgi:hypothetical protein